MHRWQHWLTGTAMAACFVAASYAAPAPADAPTAAKPPAAAAALPDAQQVSAYARQLLDDQKINPAGPGVVVLVARGDQLLFEEARGQASVELNVPLAPSQRFRIGSVTKQFAAATLLKLIEQGKASLDDPLSKFLPTYPNGERITVAQLLNHTSGVKSYTGIPGYMRNPVRRDLSTLELVDEFKNQPVDFAPGAQWAYNNSGYVLVGAVIEAITGKAWYLATEELVLRPAGLSRTLYPGERTLVPGMAQGYGADPVNGGLGTAALISMSQPHAAGALVSSAQDLWRWNRALHGGRVLSPALYARMTTPEGAAVGAGYGYGLNIGKLRGQLQFEHGGGIPGFASALAYLPASGVSVVLLSNTDRPPVSLSTVAAKLAAFTLGQPYAEPVPVPLPAAALTAFTGRYQLATDAKATRRLELRDGRLHWLRDGRVLGVLVPIGGDTFSMAGSLGLVKAHRDASGVLEALAFHPQGELDEPGQRWTRAGDLDPPADKAASAPR